jgi:hypothetical protein
MVFFSLDQTNKLTSTSQAWIFAAIAIPLTVAVFAVWILWKRRRSKAIEDEMETRTRLQEIDIEGGIIQGERFNAGRLHRAAKGDEEAIPLRQISNESANGKFSARRR